MYREGTRPCRGKVRPEVNSIPFSISSFVGSRSRAPEQSYKILADVIREFEPKVTRKSKCDGKVACVFTVKTLFQK